jgi:hypothetical protein
MLGTETRLLSDTAGETAATADLVAGVSTPAPGRGPRLDVEVPFGPARTFDSVAGLRDAVLAGALPRSSRIRTVTVADDGAVTEGSWTTIEAMASRRAELRAVYRPVWDHTMRFVSYGMIAGCVLKGLDTTVLLFSINPGLGMAWLLVVGSLIASSRWPIAPLLAMFFCFKAGVAANLFVTVLGVMAVGCALGAPAGMLIGTLVGHFRRDRLPVAPDAEPEGRRPYLLGAVLPAIGLLIAIPFYLWLSVKAFEWMP